LRVHAALLQTSFGLSPVGARDVKREVASGVVKAALGVSA
jgi:hypothetical protein